MTVQCQVTLSDLSTKRTTFLVQLLQRRQNYDALLLRWQLSWHLASNGENIEFLLRQQLVLHSPAPNFHPGGGIRADNRRLGLDAIENSLLTLRSLLLGLLLLERNELCSPRRR